MHLQSLSNIVIVTLVGSLLCMSLLVKVTSAVSSPSKKLSSMTPKGVHISVGLPRINVSLLSSIILNEHTKVQTLSMLTELVCNKHMATQELINVMHHYEVVVISCSVIKHYALVPLYTFCWWLGQLQTHLDYIFQSAI